MTLIQEPLNADSPEVQLLRKAIAFGSGEFPSTDQRSGKLLKRINSEREEWLKVSSVFHSLSWSVAVFRLGLTLHEAEIVYLFLRNIGVGNVELESDEAYKAIIIEALKGREKDLRSHAENIFKPLEEVSHTSVRVEDETLVASGYRKGYPISTYISDTNIFHKVYLDREGKMFVSSSSRDLPLRPEHPLSRTALSLEKNVSELRKGWSLVKAADALKIRIENLISYGNVSGVFA